VKIRYTTVTPGVLYRVSAEEMQHNTPGVRVYVDFGGNPE